MTKTLDKTELVRLAWLTELRRAVQAQEGDVAVGRGLGDGDQQVVIGRVDRRAVVCDCQLVRLDRKGEFRRQTIEREITIAVSREGRYLVAAH